MTEKKVLVVDDEPLFCEMVSKFLVGKGYSVVEAYGGEQALTIYSADRPDVVVLDVRMPGKDGLETLQEIRASDPEASVIMVTAVLDDEVVGQTMADGALDYITKPLNLHSLELAIKMRLGLVVSEE